MISGDGQWVARWETLRNEGDGIMDRKWLYSILFFFLLLVVIFAFAATTSESRPW